MLLLLAALGLIVYEGGIFLVLVAALPVLTGRRPRNVAHLFSLAALTAAAVALQLIDFRRMGTAPLQPELGRLLAESGSSASWGPLVLPVLELSALLQAPNWLAAFLLPVLLTAVALWQVLRASRLSPGERGVWVGVLFLASVHLFLLSALLWLLWRLWGSASSGRAIPRLLPVALLANLIFWTLFVLLRGAPGGWRSLPGTLAGYPEIYGRVIYPWATAMPVTTVLLLGLLAVLVLLVIRRPSLYAVESTLLGCTLVVLLFLGILETSYIEGRYSFFIYPVLLILAIDALWRITSSLRGPHFRSALLLVLLGMLMVTAEDFSYSHIQAIGTPEVNFRTRYDEGRKALYMHRRDFSSPALYVNEHRAPGERVISAVRVSDYYLRQTDLVYIDHRRRSFANYLACGGSRELWSHAPLIYRLEELRDTIESSTQPVWVIVYADDWGGEERQMLQTEYAERRVYRNIDATIDVYLIPATINTAINLFN
jgi:hypothetical protein